MIYPLTVQAERLAGQAGRHRRPARRPRAPSGRYAELNRQANRLAHVFRDLGLKAGRALHLVRAELARGRAARARAREGRRHRGAAELSAHGRGDRVHRRRLRRGARLRRRRAGGDVRAHPRADPARAPRRRLRRPRAPPGMLDGDALVAQASDAEPPPAPADHAGVDALHVRHDRTARRAPCASRSIPRRSCRCSSTSAIGEDDVYLTTGPLYHSGPGGFLQIAHLLGNTAVVQRHFDAEDWLRLVADVSRHHDVLGADADSPRVQPARRGEGALRPLEHEADDRQRGAVVVRAQGAVPRRLPRGLAVGGVRLDRARRGHGARAEGPAAEAGLVRRSRRRASRSRSSTTTGTRSPTPNVPGELFVRSANNFVDLPQGAGEVRRRTAAATSSPSATSRIATTRASTTSATARTT